MQRCEPAVSNTLHTRTKKVMILRFSIFLKSGLGNLAQKTAAGHEFEAENSLGISVRLRTPHFYIARAATYDNIVVWESKHILHAVSSLTR